MFDKLIDKWNRISQLGVLRKASFAAIKEGDANRLHMALRALGQNDLYYDEKVNLVRDSIKSRNLGVFRVVIDFIGDPNFEMKVNYLSTKPGQVTRHTWSPLSYALTVAHSHDIAMHLAKDPRTHVNTQDVLNAREAGMQDVADVLQRASLRFSNPPEFTNKVVF